MLFGGGVAQLGIQALGAGAVVLWMGGTSYALMLGIKALGVLRIPAEAEIKYGIDVYEHGQSMQPDLMPMPTEEVAHIPSRGRAVAPAGD